MDFCGSESTEGNAEEVAKQVYSMCDVYNTNNVPVSVLLDFINNPDSVFNFAELKYKLDSEGNMSVTCETFIRAVTDWSSCAHLLKLDFDNNSYCEEEDSSATTANFKDCVKELKHKNELLNQELHYIKNHVMEVEDHCGTLLNEKKNYHQKLIEMGKNVEQHFTKKDDLEYKISPKQCESELHDLKKLAINARRDIEEFKRKIKKSEAEKKELQVQINLLENREKTKIKVIKQLQLEIENKEQEVLYHCGNSTKLRTEFNKQQKHILHYVKCNKTLKDNISELQSIAMDYELRFIYLRNILNPLICSPSHKTSICKVLKRIINCNPSRPLSSLAHLVSINLDSPLIAEDFFFDNINEDDCFSVLNDLDLCCNNNQALVEVNFLCETSLQDEMLLADQEVHKNECSEIINKQKSQIEELALAFEKTKELAQKLQGKLEHIEANLSKEETINDRLKAENLRLWRKIKMKNDLQEELAELRQNKNRKIGNFSKMELKLERCEATHEKLNAMLNVERSISQTLAEKKRALAKEKLMLEEQLQNVLGFSKEWEFACELGANAALDKLDFQDKPTKVMEALKTDLNTIDDRYKVLQANYKVRVDRLLEEFMKLELKLSFHNSIDCVNHLRNLKDACVETHTVTLNYGAINREQLLLKYINMMISQKEKVLKRRIYSCCVFLILVVLVVLVFGMEMFDCYTNVPLYIQKSYLGVPPPT